ncbi:signal peptidase I [Candidatus Saccharibacteria bacterium]|nr:signal peptidase I [Candidatus Saccharibacteria bacterium]NCS82938.1 signal peptidase I [Candidatus Saccharibacteria bacterium]
MEASYFTRHPIVKDVLNLVIFVIFVIIGTILINTFVFRSYSVIGPSMEPTMYTGDRLIVNRLPITWSQLRGESYVPERGQVIVFENPRFSVGEDEYLVKRVIALPGERVTLNNGSYTVYNDEHPEGFNPDDTNNGEPGSPTSGEVDKTVPQGEIFVSGDHRSGNYSYDSRNGLGTIPLYDVIGPVSLRVFPFNELRGF